MKRAANPRNETTRLSALATGLRLTTTAAPKTSVSNAKVQNKNPDIFQATDKHRSNTDVKSEPEKPPTICVNLCGFLLLLVSLRDHAMLNSADYEEFLLVMHHVRARKARNGIILSQENRLLRANLLAHAAENAADHVDIELVWVFLDFGE